MSQVDKKVLNGWLYVGLMVGMSVGVIFLILWLGEAMKPPKHVEIGVPCIGHLKQSMTAMLIYSTDHDDRIPPANRWMDQASPYVKSDELFRCPELKNPRSDEYGYAMNIKASSVKTDRKHLEEFIVLFDSILLMRNARSGLLGFPDRKVRRTCCVFLDGHATSLDTKRIRGGELIRSTSGGKQ